MQGFSDPIWLLLFALIYALALLYWSRVALREGAGAEGFFSAGHSLAPWIGALVLAGVSLAGWLVLGGAELIGNRGFQMPALLTAGVSLALPGVVFFKRAWIVAERLRVSSQAEMFRAYYGSPVLVVASVAVAVLFALGFCGLQLRAIAQLAEDLSGGTVSRLGASFVLGFALFAGAGIGGMRAIGYFGVIQTVLAFAAIALLAGVALVQAGGFGALNAGLMAVAAEKGTAALFGVGKVIAFTPGLGRGTDPASAQTAVANFGLALSLMGFQASPLALKLVLSLRNPRGLAAGQTWVLAGGLGALTVFGVALIGAASLIAGKPGVAALLLHLAPASPWFAALAFAGLVAAVQLLAGLALFTAAEGLVRNLYQPYFHARLGKAQAVSLTRIAIAVLALVAVVMQAIAPVAVSALAALALPMAVQLWAPMLGVTWLRWITRPAAATGVGFGLAAVFLTEPAGLQILSFLGLELPWGRWPWTMPSALWGIAANLAAVTIISAITDRGALGPEARAIRTLFDGPLATRPGPRALATTAWSLCLIWLFLAVGPGLIFGNTAFVGVRDGAPVWLMGIPSLWAWSIGGWIGGLGLIWFLAYRMEMAASPDLRIPVYAPPHRLHPDPSAREAERLRALVITAAASGALVLFTALSFGG